MPYHVGYLLGDLRNPNGSYMVGVGQFLSGFSVNYSPAVTHEGFSMLVRVSESHAGPQMLKRVTSVLMKGMG